MAEVPTDVIETVCNLIQEINDGRVALMRATRRGSGEAVDILAVRIPSVRGLYIVPVAELVPASDEQVYDLPPLDTHVRFPDDVVVPNGASIQ